MRAAPTGLAPVAPVPRAYSSNSSRYFRPLMVSAWLFCGMETDGQVRCETRFTTGLGVRRWTALTSRIASPATSPRSAP